MTDLSKTPFHLGKTQQEWVKKTLDQMSVEEKAGQLFLVIGQSDHDEGHPGYVPEISIWRDHVSAGPGRQIKE